MFAYLRCHVVCGSTFSLEHLSLRSSEELHKSEIHDLGGDRVVDQDVFQLDITMDDSLGMYVGDALGDLTEESSGERGLITIAAVCLLNEVE